MNTEEKLMIQLRDWLRMMPPLAEEWFDSFAPRNPLIGSDAGRNTNHIMIQTGRRLAVQTIIDAAKRAKEQPIKKEFAPNPSELANILKPA